MKGWIIPDPQFVPVNYHLDGSLLSRAKYVLTNPPRFRLIKDWVVTLPSSAQVVVPKGFVTDFASIPRALWAVPGFSPSGPLLWGAILHDFGYQYGYLLRKLGPKATVRVFEGFPRSFFDGMLRTVTIEKTGAKFIAGAAHAALHHFGGNVWDNYRTKGPSAYNTNSLGLPGLLANGGVSL